MSQRAILLVEDNPDDEALTIRALKKNNITNELIIARDSVEAINYLLGSEEGRTARVKPSIVLLDLKLPKIDGLEVLRRFRSDPRTELLPVVILTSSREEQYRVQSYSLGGQQALSASRWTSASSLKPCDSRGSIGSCSMSRRPIEIT